MAVGASLVVDSDGHAPGDLLTEELARQIVIGAGLTEEEFTSILETNPMALLAKASA